jgi:tetratricopeptide (TPR) repeat protein
VSLLMDALKRAELAKQQGQVDPAEPGLSLEQAATPDPGNSPTTLPELPSLEDLDEEFIAHANKSAAQRPARAAGQAQASGVRPGGAASSSSRATDTARGVAAERDAIRNAFAAKNSAGNGRKGILTVAALGLLVIGGIGAYFWLQFKPVQGLAAQKAPIGLEASARQTITPPPPPVQDTRPAPSAISPVAADAQATMQAQAPREEQSPFPRRAARRPSTLSEPDTRIQLTASHPGVDPAVAEGYRLLQAGDLAGSRAAYAGALRADSRNADALHGVAAISLREGRTDQAEAAYQRILEANPGDATAQAGLVGLSGQGDPVAGESRMKSLLAAQGDLPVVNFALGNLFARQQRWNEAQQAYFKAVTADAANPDYLFNLAVSLDQLRQPKPAAQYYGQALTAAESRPAAFDRALAARRMRELQP